ncbi:MAG TPA: alanine racemase [Ignavibacteriaceae bacterium]|nr:alanine racemase [Ignavibacteriaceae bacterium]
MFNTSIIEISRSALESNLKFIRKTLGKKLTISSVIKGNAYGHSIEAFVPIAEKCGQEHFSVYSADEALRVKEIASNGPTVMIMGMIDNDEIGWAIENDIEFFVFDSSRLEATIKASKRIKKKAKIHLEIETGMNRTGFNQQQLESELDNIKSNFDFISIEGLCTHYAGAESIANYLRVKEQIKLYTKTNKWLLENGVVPKTCHTACSAAAMRYPNTRMDMARIGILQYGFWPSDETLINYLSNKEDKTDPLQRVITWKSRVMSTKEVKTGEFIGYGTTYLAHKKLKIATIPVGYAHGFSRSLSNMGRVLIHGKRVGVVGIVNMNLMTVDVTDIPDIKKGDEVVLIGHQGDLSISVASFSELSNQLNYELLTRLPQRIPRVISN